MPHQLAETTPYYRLDETLCALQSTIFEAWLSLAPEQPSESVTVRAPVPEWLLGRADHGEAIEAVRRLFIVQDAEMVASVHDDLPGAGISATCRPYADVTRSLAAARSLWDATPA